MNAFAAWLRGHRTSLASAIRELVRAPVASLLNAIVLAVVIALPLIGASALDNVRASALRVFGDAARIGVFLAFDASGADIAAIEARLRADRRVGAVRFVGRDAALEGLRKNEALTDAIGTLKSNPLPDAFDVTLRERDPDGADALVAALRAAPKVAHVQHDAQWLRRLEAGVALGRAILLAAAVLLGVGLAAVTYQMVRSQVSARAAEVEVSRLVGATDATIRRPFAYLGALSGLAGGLLAWGIAEAALQLIQPAVSALATQYGTSFVLSGIPAAIGAGVATVAAGLGLLGAWLAVSVHLHKLPA